MVSFKLCIGFFLGSFNVKDSLSLVIFTAVACLCAKEDSHLVAVLTGYEASIWVDFSALVEYLYISGKVYAVL